MKRSNRLVLLVGVFLAIIAFVGILLLSQGGSDGSGDGVRPPTTGPVVVALVDIPLSTKVRSDQLTTKTLDLTAILPGAYTDPSQVVGQIIRQPIAKDAQVTSAATSGGTNGVITNLTVPAGQRAIAIQVDQTTGVGTVIKPGDYVDVIIGLTGDKFPVITVDEATDAVTVVTGLNGTSVKVLIQGLQVLGTLLPPVAPNEDGTIPSTTDITLNGQSEIVILSATPQQAEVLKFSQMESSVSLVLRSPDDFLDPLTGALLPPITTQTTGVILKTLVDDFGVLIPELVQTVAPTTP